MAALLWVTLSFWYLNARVDSANASECRPKRQCICRNSFTSKLSSWFVKRVHCTDNWLHCGAVSLLPEKLENTRHVCREVAGARRFLNTELVVLRRSQATDWSGGFAPFGGTWVQSSSCYLQKVIGNSIQLWSSLWVSEVSIALLWKNGSENWDLNTIWLCHDLQRYGAWLLWKPMRRMALLWHGLWNT